jgi:transposase, IS5 family
MKQEERRSNAGRKPYDTILKFTVLVLQSLHNLSDEQTEFMIRDRLSFMRFLDLGLEDAVPDATTIWLFREDLAEVGRIDKLFGRVGQHLEAKGHIARGSDRRCQHRYRHPISATGGTRTTRSRPARRDRIGRRPAMNAQKDKDARWTYRKSFYDYKNHIGVDKSHKIRKWDVTDPSVHDSQKLEQLLDQTNTGKEVWADSAYARRRSRRGLRPRA